MHGTLPHSSALELARLLKETKCVIFDFDGVIADSEPLSLGTLRDTLADFGLDLPIGEVRSLFLGKSLKTIEAYLSKHGPKGASAGFSSAWQTDLFEKFRAELYAIPGLVDLLDALKRQNLTYCVASSSSFERLEVALDALQLQERFPNLFSAEQVKNGKPSPDLFLFAAAQIGCDPAACVVIEDSPHGIRAATAAGMHAIGFVGGSHLREIQTEHAALLFDAGAIGVTGDYEGLRELISLF